MKLALLDSVERFQWRNALESINNVVDHIFRISNVFPDFPDTHGVVFGRGRAEVFGELSGRAALLFVLGDKAIPYGIAGLNPALLPDQE